MRCRFNYPFPKRTIHDDGQKKRHDTNQSWGRRSIGAVMDQALEYIGADTPILLSFDIDALDPVSYGSTGTPSENGLTLRQGQIICDRVQKAGTLVAMDLVRSPHNLMLLFSLSVLLPSIYKRYNSYVN